MNVIITRHLGCVEYCMEKLEKELGKTTYIQLYELKNQQLDQIKKGDVIIGILPIHLIMEVIKRGAEYYHIIIPNRPRRWRNKELTKEEMERCGAYVQKIEGIVCGDSFA